MASAAEHLRSTLKVIATIRAASLRPLLDRLQDLRAGGAGAVWVIGNGGSQANASHLVLHLQEHGLKARDLLAETAYITAMANDHSYAVVASRTLRTLGAAADTLIVITGSGDSPNVILALVEARRLGMRTYGLLGFAGGQALALCDQAVLVASSDYGCIEDAHSALVHAINAELGDLTRT